MPACLRRWAPPHASSERGGGSAGGGQVTAWLRLPSATVDAYFCTVMATAHYMAVEHTFGMGAVMLLRHRRPPSHAHCSEGHFVCLIAYPPLHASSTISTSCASAAHIRSWATTGQVWGTPRWRGWYWRPASPRYFPGSLRLVQPETALGSSLRALLASSRFCDCGQAQVRAPFAMSLYQRMKVIHAQDDTSPRDVEARNKGAFGSAAPAASRSAVRTVLKAAGLLLFLTAKTHFACRDDAYIRAVPVLEPSSADCTAASARPTVHIQVTAGPSAGVQSSQHVYPLCDTLSLPLPTRPRGARLLDAANLLRAAQQPSAAPLPGYRSMAQFGTVQELMRTK